MNKKFTGIALLALFLMTSGCASIVSKSRYPIFINSAPSQSNIIIKDKNGIKVFSGQTPTSLVLDSGSGFFGKARYQVTFMKEGYMPKTVPVEFKIDAWYFGNIAFGGLIGMLIVDPATGAMYKLANEYVNETLIPKSANINEGKELKVYGMDEIPVEWKENLVLISK